MRLAIIAAAMVVGSSIAAPARAATPGPASKTGTGQEFAWRLLRALPADRNLFVSPESIRLALQMAAAGARGETAAELEAALAMPPGDAGLGQTASLLARWEALASAGTPQGGRLQLQVANRAWVQQGRPLKEAFVAALRDTFRSPAGVVDFERQPEAARAEINRWVSDRTAGKIPALLGRGTVTPDTRLVLTSAIRFKATWARTFVSRQTKDAPFFVTRRRKVSAPLMHQVAQLRIAAIEGGQLLELPYVGGDVAMDVVLPQPGRRLPELERALVAGALPGWLSLLKPARVDASLPRWRSSTSADLVATLKALGMVKAFARDQADFSGIDGRRDLHVSAVVHQAAVDVDERGTEAVAATAVGVVASAAVPTHEEPPVVFRADRPFLYVIRDLKTGAILFMGRLLDPTAR